EATPGTNAYVDMEGLDNISSGTTLGNGYYVSIPGLVERSKNGESISEALTDDLQDALDKISNSYHYDYSLEIHPSRDLLAQDGVNHTIRVECVFGDTVLPVGFSYRWHPVARTAFSVGTTFFIPPYRLPRPDPCGSGVSSGASGASRNNCGAPVHEARK